MSRAPGDRGGSPPHGRPRPPAAPPSGTPVRGTSAPPAAAAARRPRPELVSRAGQLAVVDEAEHALRAERSRELVRVHGQVRQRVGADGVQGGAAVPGDHLDVPVEQHPVSRLRPVAVAQRVPAVMRLRVLQHRHHVRRGRVGLDADVGPRVQRPRIGAAPGHPALLARRPGAQRQREAGEGRARLPVVGAVDAAGLPDQRLHLGRRPGPRQLQVVPGHADDRRSQRAVPRRGRGARARPAGPARPARPGPADEPGRSSVTSCRRPCRGRR